MMLYNISAVMYSNMLNMDDKKIRKLIFTALTYVFCSMYSILSVKAYIGISQFRQSESLSQVDHIQHACAGDVAELTVVRVGDRVGFAVEKHYFSNV